MCKFVKRYCGVDFMLYVSGKTRQNNEDVYLVTDTEDDVSQPITYKNLISTAAELKRAGILIRGVDGSVVKVLTLKSNTTQQSKIRLWLAKAKLTGEIEHWEFNDNYTKVVRYKRNGENLSGRTISVPPVLEIGDDCFEELSSTYSGVGPLAGGKLLRKLAVMKAMSEGHSQDIAEISGFKLIVPGTVRFIGQRALKGLIADCCVFDTSNVKVIGERAMENFRCNGCELSFPSVETIGFGAFRYHPDEKSSSTGMIRALSFGRMLREIPDEMCANMPELYKVEVPNGVESIGVCAFSNCVSLIDAITPASVLTIGRNAFLISADSGVKSKTQYSLTIQNSMAVVTDDIAVGRTVFQC